ncbi:MAG: SIR2 family protein [Thiotrichales bacterium]|nr:SIR2 family protein [Thiotrichales bacterium]
MKVELLNLEKIKKTIQDCNLNLLIGSGLSSPYLSTLGNIEIFLTELEASDLDEDKKVVIRASVYKRFFDDVIKNNLNFLDTVTDKEAEKLLKNYSEFLKTINHILLSRKTTLLSKQANLFTTNIDICLEKALENSRLEFNDGFAGRFSPVFNLSNFKKTVYKTTQHFENKSEIPIFNVLKMHGSLTWKIEEEQLLLSDLSEINRVESLNFNPAVEITDESTFEEISTLPIPELVFDKDQTIENAKSFAGGYARFAIVNPNKDKFRDTVLNENYYEILRMYSNELEKENTVLFVLGFSFADEHIRNLRLRVANSNPTLNIFIICRTKRSSEKFEAVFQNSVIKNNNISCIVPPQIKCEDDEECEYKDEYSLDLTGVHQHLFSKIMDAK